MVEVVGERRPLAIGCATEVREGMEIRTGSPMVLEAREGVLESLLINHPLDCPVCDQAGECDLQDFSFNHGQPTSRFREEKHVKHTKDLGPEVRLYGNRCINCTRCVRFSQEISGTSDIVQVNRGGRNVVDTFPGIEFDNPLSGNVVDICPVGALVSRDFLHKSRVWQLTETPSVCPHCATGCSTLVHTRDEEIMRIKPRANPEVNGFWMCDTGRLGYGFVSDGRIKHHAVRGEGGKLERTSFHGAVSALADKVAEAGEAVYAFASAFMTNEELYSLRRIVPPERIGLLAREDGKEQRFYPQWGDSERNPALAGQHERAALYEDGASFVISADRNANRTGAQRILGKEACSDKQRLAVEKAIRNGDAKVVIAFTGLPEGLRFEDAFLETLQRAGHLCLIDLTESTLHEVAGQVIPGAAFAEKEGTYTNGRGSTQRLGVARPTVGHARPELELLYTLGKRLGIDMPGYSAGQVFDQLAAEVGGFEGTTWKGLEVSVGARWSPHQASHKSPLKKLPMLPTAPEAPAPEPVASQEG
ncbi:MAG: NADH-quinone oxidoreductase subunit G, partial [Planctomycetota bacterium]|jgi:NADH-quinone oxidoreductase subunit G